MITIKILKFNAYVWAFCAVGWGWAAFVFKDPNFAAVSFLSLLVSGAAATLRGMEEDGTYRNG